MTGFLAHRCRIARRAMLRSPLLLLLALGLSSGCALPPAPVDHHYRLEPGTSQARFDSPILDGTLRVKRPRASAFIDGTRIAQRDADNPTEIVRLSYQHWVDTPTLMLQDGLIRVLREAGAAKRVVASDLRVHSDYTLAGRLFAFEMVRGEEGSTAHLELELSLIRNSDRILMLEGVYTQRESADADAPSAGVEALSRALDQVLARFLDDLATLPENAPAEISAWRQ